MPSEINIKCTEDSKSMKAALLIFVVWLGAVLAFVISGYMANWAYMLFGCLWTSSTLFGVSFLALASGIGGLVTYLFDLTDWFN